MPLPTLLEKGTVENDKSVTAKDYIINSLKKKIDNIPTGVSDRVLIIEAGTGSGKSVTIPPEIYMNLYNKLGRNIVVTQPRQVSAIRTVQLDIVKHYKFTIGKDIGFQTSSFSRKPINGLIFVTIGTLLQQLKRFTFAEFISTYSVVIIDEAHDRTIETDITIYFIKIFLESNWDNPRCPIFIFMSATLEKEIFLDYFKNPELISVKGRTYPIKEFWLDQPSSNYMYTIFDIIKNLRDKTDDYKNDYVKDILIFMFGDKPITKLMMMLDEYNAELPSDNKMCIIKFTSATYSDGQEDAKMLESNIDNIEIIVNDKKYKPKRKVIIATPVAETSITIDTLKYVIDSGFRRAVEFDPLLSINTNVIKPVSKDMATQRRGRVGRVAPGDWYPIMTEEVFNSLQENKFADMLTSDISSSLLAIIIKDGGYMGDIKLIEKFSSDSLLYSIEKLLLLGAIEVNHYKKDNGLTTEENIYRESISHFYYLPTDVGRCMNMFRKLNLESAKMILSGYNYGANILDLITIASLLQSQVTNFRYIPRKVFSSPTRNLFLLCDTFIDLIFLFDEFISQEPSNLRTWCEENNVSYINMLNASELRDSIIEDIVYMIGFDPLYNSMRIPASEYSLRSMLLNTPDIGVEEVIKLKSCIYSGYKQNILIYDDERECYITTKNVEIFSPTSLTNMVTDCCGTSTDVVMPRYMVYSNATSVIYQSQLLVNIDYYSVMDNFVDIDWSLI